MRSRVEKLEKEEVKSCYTESDNTDVFTNRHPRTKLIKSHKRAEGETYLENFVYFYNVKYSFKLQFSNAGEKKYDEKSRWLGNKS